MNGRNVYNATNLHASIPGNSVTSWLHCTYGNESFETVELVRSLVLRAIGLGCLKALFLNFKKDS